MPETPIPNGRTNGQANVHVIGEPISPDIPADLAGALDELHASLQLLSAALSEADRELTLAAERATGLYVAQYLRKL